MKYLLPILLVGCSFHDTLEDEYFACGLSETPECLEIRKKIQSREDAKKRRAKRNKCKPGAQCYYGDDAKRIYEAMRGR